MADSSVSWMADAFGPPFRGVVSNSRTSAPTPLESAKRDSWHGRTRPLPSVFSVVLVSVHRRPGRCSETWAAVSRMSSVNCSGGSGLGRGLADGEGVLGHGFPGQRRSDAGRVRDERPADDDGGDGDADADERVGTPPRGSGPAQDRGARPGRVLGLLAQRLEERADVGGRDVAVHRELRGRGLQHPLGLGTGQPDLAGQVAHATLARWVSSSALRWVTGSLARASRVAFALLVQALVAVPDARGVPTLRV